MRLTSPPTSAPGVHVLIGTLLFLAGATLFAQTPVLNWPTVKKEIRQTFPDVNHISTTSLHKWLKSPDRGQPHLLDARAPAEYQVSHIKGATRALTLKDAQKALGNLDKKTPIVVYCSVGYRSAKLAQALQKAGYSNVSNLEGGIFAWKNEGRPVYKDGKRVTKVHPYSREWGVLLAP